MSNPASPTPDEARFYQRFVERSPQAMLVVHKDTIVYCNQAAYQLFGCQAASTLLGKHFAAMVPTAHRDKAEKLLSMAEQFSTTSPLDHSQPGFWIQRLDGKAVEVDLVVLSTLFEGTSALQIIAQDITQQRHAAAALQLSESRYALAAKGANDGLWDWDLCRDQVYYSQRWCQMLGIESNHDEASPNQWLDRIHPEDLLSFTQKLTAHLDKLVPHFEMEHRLRHEDGAYRWMHCRGVAVYSEKGNATRIAGSLRDITERKRVEHQLFHDAFHDNLTGLANRALFIEHLDRALSRGKNRQDQLIAILFVDFDRFKLVNDSLGHLVGDKLLVAIARRLRKALPANDLFARLGGDEFAALIEGISFPVEARQRAQAIHQCLAEPFSIENHELYTSVSIGIAYGVPGLDQPFEVLRDADTAMYRAKARGKSQSVIFDQTMHDDVRKAMRLENDLRKAMERNEFEIFYQPIIDLRSLQLAGFEALLRWHHPTKGLIYPNQFIGLAEETGIILNLGLNVLRQACTVMNDLHKTRNPDLFLHVNLSFRQMMQSDLANEIAAVLKETHFPPSRLKLELTESVVAEPGDFAVALLHDLRQLGLQLCLDDFGTGYASLSYLHRLPIDSLKIDKSFIERLLKGNSGKDIVPTIITLAHNLGLSVVAEGIENEAQFRRLQDLGCEFAQGYYFGKAVTAAAAKALCQQAVLAGFPCDGQLP